jgi:hypothetical protein
MTDGPSREVSELRDLLEAQLGRQYGRNWVAVLAKRTGDHPKTLSTMFRRGKRCDPGKRDRLLRAAGIEPDQPMPPRDPRDMPMEEIIGHLTRELRGVAFHLLPDAPIIIDVLKGHISVWAKMVRAEVRRLRRGA